MWCDVCYVDAANWTVYEVRMMCEHLGFVGDEAAATDWLQIVYSCCSRVTKRHTKRETEQIVTKTYQILQ